MTGRLQGRRALITGGSSGIGQAVALRFVQEGASVMINHAGDGAGAAATLAMLRAETPRGGEPERHEAIEADVADRKAARGLVSRTIDAFGGLDILINNAGIQAETPGTGFDPQRLERILAVNLIAAATLSDAFIAHAIERGGGVIINTSSVHEAIPKPGYLAYAMSKGGLGALTRTLALEFADRGIRVNAVAPGAVVTPINASWTHDPSRRRAVSAHIPVGHPAEAHDIAPVYAFLASSEARYITGQTIYACGGLTLYGEFRSTWSS